MGAFCFQRPYPALPVLSTVTTSNLPRHSLIVVTTSSKPKSLPNSIFIGVIAFDCPKPITFEELAVKAICLALMQLSVVTTR